MTKKELTCINCPLGCQLTVTYDENKLATNTLTLDDVDVQGNTCPRGLAYGKKEIVAPTRIVTSSIPVEGGCYAMASVKTAHDIPKGKIFSIMKEILATKITAPVKIGDVLIHDVADTGVDIVATRNVKKC